MRRDCAVKIARIVTLLLGVNTEDEIKYIN